MTDLLKELGELAFGSRLKRLVKRTDSDIAKIYREMGIDARPRWFPLLVLLSRRKRLSITDAAAALQYSHTAINKLSKEMARDGLLRSTGDPADGRRRMLSLTRKGRDTVLSLTPIWEDVRQITIDLVKSSEHNILKAAGAIEEQLDKESVYRRMRMAIESRMLDQIEIMDYTSRYKHHFSPLNRQWLEEHFRVEGLDERILSNPHGEIIKKGGCVLFARLGRRIVGTAALIRHTDQVFELAKMAVNKDFRRRFVGTRLTSAIIEHARSCDAKHLYLETSAKLKPALKLYEKMGFERVATSPIPAKFKRRRIMMRLDLRQQE